MICKLQITAIKQSQHNLKDIVFLDITKPFSRYHISDIGKKVQVWESTNFDAGFYDITGFLRL